MDKILLFIHPSNDLETKMPRTMSHRFQLWGWIIFIFSALFFMAASIRAADPIGLIGGALFLPACIVFLVPLFAELGASASNLSRPRKYSRYLRGWWRAVNSQLHEPAAPKTPPTPEHQRDRIRRHQARSELRFFASTR